MRKFNDLTGKVFGLLTVVARSEDKTAVWYECLCACGNRHQVRGGNLTNGSTTSCTCVQRQAAAERIKARLTTHGESKTKLFRVWVSIKTRCNKPHDPSFKEYGARGITICAEWDKSFEQFKKDIGKRPSPNHSVDRKDNYGPYCKDNCKWSTPLEQAANTRVNRNIEYEGVTKCVAVWAREKGLSKGCVYHRLRTGWSVEAALEVPSQRKKKKKGVELI